VLPSVANTQSAQATSTCEGAGSSARGSAPEREKIPSPRASGPAATGTIAPQSRFQMRIEVDSCVICSPFAGTRTLTGPAAMAIPFRGHESGWPVHQ
jgi:hypothetical protein